MSNSRKVLNRAGKMAVTPHIEGTPCDTIGSHNAAIAMAYLCVGLSSTLMNTPLNIYMVSILEAEPQQQNTMAVLQTLPWSLKLVFGFVSDVLPIFGMHRKPYLAIGAIWYSLSFVAYGVIGVNSIQMLSLCVFSATCGLLMMDVMADTMCVQRSKFEPEHSKGQMQSTFYSIRFAGSLIGAIIGALFYNKASWGWGMTFFQFCLLSGLMPLVLVLPWLPSLVERFHRVPHLGVARKEKIGGRDPSAYGSIELTSDPALASEANTNSQETIANRTSGRHVPPMSTPVDDSAGEFSEQSSLLPSFPSGKARREIDDDEKAEEGGEEEEGEGEGEDENLEAGFHGVEANISGRNGAPALPETLLVSLTTVHEEEGNPIAVQVQEIWETVQLRSVWWPMTFVFAYNIMQIPNVAWQSFLQLGLHFESWILGLTVIIGSLMTLAGTLAYKYYFFKASWRKIYFWSTMLTAFFSLMQLCLIFQINQKYLHLSNYLFALGDDVISAYISGIQFLPVCIMYMGLCPQGAEGSTYAMLTTFGNIALVCANNLGDHLSGLWDVSNHAMRAHDYSGLWKLSVLTSVLSVLPLTLLNILPRDAEEQAQLKKSPVRSKLAGAVFLSVLFSCIAWTVIVALTRVLAEH